MAGSKPRDKQKQRLYSAQNLCSDYGCHGNYTIRDAQKFVNKVMKQKYTYGLFEQYRFPFSVYPSEIIVEANAGNHATRRFKSEYMRVVNLIRLNYLGRNQFVVLHEIAHQITWGHEAHGPEFVDVLAKLLKRHMGVKTYNEFINACASKKVRIMGKSGKARVPRKRQTV